MSKPMKLCTSAMYGGDQCSATPMCEHHEKAKGEPKRWHPGEHWKSFVTAGCGCGSWEASLEGQVKHGMPSTLSWHWCPTHAHAAEAFEVLQEARDKLEASRRSTMTISCADLLGRIDALLAAREKGATEVRSGKTED